MSLIMPNGSRTVPLGGATPGSPASRPQSPGVSEAEALAYLYEQLKMEYPGVPDADLRTAAQKLYSELRTKQSDEFHKRFFPERVNQAAASPRATAPPVAVGQVAQDEQRPWKYAPGKPGNMEFTDTPEHQDRQREAILKRVAEEQANAAKTQAQNQENARRAAGIVPGQARPIQPPSQGTAYQPGVMGFPDADGNQVDDRMQALPPGLIKNTGQPGNLAPIGPKGERWMF